MGAINYNTVVNGKISVAEKKLEDKTAKDTAAGNDKKLGDDSRGDPEVKTLRREIERLQACVKSVELPATYVPNKRDHLRRYIDVDDADIRAFCSDISEETMSRSAYQRCG